MLATGVAGPARMQAGAVRDLVIGVTMVRADGVIAKAGGKVVKNVAGYDVGKLLHRRVRDARLVTQAAVPAAPGAAAPAGTSSCRPPPRSGARRVQRVAARAVRGDRDRARRLGAGADRAGGRARRGHRGRVAARAAQASRLLGDGAEASGRRRTGGARYRPASDRGLVKATTELAGTRRAAGRGGPGRRRGRHHRRGARQRRRRRRSSAAGHRPGRGRGVRQGAAGRRGPAGRGRRRAGRAAAECGEVDVWGPVPGLDLMRRVKEQFDPARCSRPAGSWEGSDVSGRRRHHRSRRTATGPDRASRPAPHARPSTRTGRRPSWSPTACTAGSACPAARRTCCGARRWTPRAAGSS